MWPEHPELAWLAAVLCFAVMVPWQFGYRMGTLPVGSWRLWAAAWAGNLMLGYWGTFLMLSAPAAVIYLLLWLAGFTGQVTYAQLGQVVLVASSLIATIGWLQVWYGPVVKRVRVTLPEKANALAGLTIAQISDLHVGSTIGRAYVDKVVRRVMALKPDLIAFTGDFGDGPAAKLEKEWKPLANLTAPLGKFYVTGNHEYYWNGDEWAQAARDCGFTVLLNENRMVDRGNARLTVAGVTDHAAAYFSPAQRRNVERAMAGGEGANFKLLLAHQPAGFEQAESSGFDLQLSGHTHGGQFFPFTFFMPFAHTYHRGLNRIGKLLLYINVGTGYWGPPNRFGVPSEISLLTLETAAHPRA